MAEVSEGLSRIVLYMATALIASFLFCILFTDFSFIKSFKTAYLFGFLATFAAAWVNYCKSD